MLDTSLSSLHVREVFIKLANAVNSEVSHLDQSLKEPILSYDESNKEIYVKFNEFNIKLPTSLLRKSCRCAGCMDELTNKSLIKPTESFNNITPIKITKKGNYAIEINWSDNHRSIYPYLMLDELDKILNVKKL